ncbi:MYG1 protein, partial [Columbina picui]|nr:MYG1 protein [Columbina picui]
MRAAVRAARLMAAAGTAGITGITGTGAKRPRPEPAPRIGTHDGTFHCDEVLACYLLRLLPQYRVRHRAAGRGLRPPRASPGNRAAPARALRAFPVPWEGLTPPSTAHLSPGRPRGAVSPHQTPHKIGDQFVPAWLDPHHVPRHVPHRVPRRPQLYENFVEEIDAIDNGIAQAEGEPRYAVTTTLSARVAHLNPRWNDPRPDPEAGFKRATELVGGEFMERLDYYHGAWLPARALVEEAVRKRFQVPNWGGCGWGEPESCPSLWLCSPPLVLYPDGAGQWRLQSVPAGPHTFQSRLPLPEPWRGLRDEPLSLVTGIPGCVFVHASGFTGGNRTREGALEMARRTLALRDGGGAQSG